MQPTNLETSIKDIGEDLSRILKRIDIYSQSETTEAQNLKANLVALQEFLSALESPIKHMDDQLRNVRDHMDSRSRSEIPQWISPQPYLNHHA